MNVPFIVTSVLLCRYNFAASIKNGLMDADSSMKGEECKYIE